VSPEDATEPIIAKGLKSQWIAQVKDTAGKLLSATDWMIIRKIERSVELPTNIQAFRTAVLAEVNRLEVAIAGCADVEALIAVVATQQWPTNE
jgi:pyruvate/oxaloacetate carboxyltransferase